MNRIKFKFSKKVQDQSRQPPRQNDSGGSIVLRALGSGYQELGVPPETMKQYGKQGVSSVSHISSQKPYPPLEKGSDPSSSSSTTSLEDHPGFKPYVLPKRKKKKINKRKKKRKLKKEKKVKFEDRIAKAIVSAFGQVNVQQQQHQQQLLQQQQQQQ